MSKACVYDFDGTIYDGDSSIDFFLYALKKGKAIKYLPKVIIYFILCVLRIITLERFKEVVFSFVLDLKDYKSFINEFWMEKEKNINSYFLENVKREDNIIVISASPTFLLKPYLDRFSNVKLIATDFDNNMKVIGKNCKGEEKVKLLKEKYEDVSISSFYSDSLSDLPLANISDNAYFVTHGRVDKWDTEKQKAKKNTKCGIMISILFFAFYLILGIQLTYNYEYTSNFDLLFDSDCGRVYGDISSILAGHKRIKVHPLFVILIQPIYYILSGIFQSNVLATVVLLSLVSSITIFVMFKALSLFLSDRKKIAIGITVCFGLTFSSMLFSAEYELYNIACLCLVTFWYFVMYKVKKGWNRGDFVTLVFLGVLNTGITITNIAVYAIGCLVLLISKSVKFKKLLLAGILTLLVTFCTSIIQKAVWTNTALITDVEENMEEEKDFIDHDIGIENIKNVVRDSIYNPIISSDIILKSNQSGNAMIYFKGISKVTLIVVSVFLVLVLFYTIKNMKKNLAINIGLILTILFNFTLHLIYGNDSTFIYSLHFVYLFFLLFGINYSNEDKKENKAMSIFLLAFSILEAVINTGVFIKLFRYVKSYVTPNFYALYLKPIVCVLITVISVILILSLLMILIHFLKKIKAGKTLSIKLQSCVFSFCIIVAIESFFVMLVTNSNNGNILFKKIDESVSAYNIKLGNYRAFKNNYTRDVNSYLKYANDYGDYTNRYNCNLKSDISNNDYYFFGMGNRRKMMYKDGVLKDIDTNTPLYTFDVDAYLIIPNEYSVLIKEKDGAYTKIYENNDGVFISANSKKTLIPGTDEKISLYDFKNEEHREIKKVLYSEVLFNIKDGAVYSNIFVYDKPWYRDGAYASMVLKATENTKLISSWVNSITDIYDMQNGGIKEPDNLGELLYILSTDENINEDNKVVQDIIKEAENIAKEDGYIKGTTDYYNRYRYQNMWYDLGLRAITGNKSSFSYLTLSDDYMNTIWWDKTENTYTFDTPMYPYLSYGNYHAQRMAPLYASSSLYPLSWEQDATFGNYDSVSVINENLKEEKIAPTHSWSASEMLLFLLDETGNLNIDVKRMYQE